MDFIFECFYEDTLDKITRNGLQDRSSRRDVLDHLNAIIGGCSDGQNMHTEEVARIAVLSAVRYHRDKKEANGDVCLMGKFHNILYIALRTCWDWGVRDSAVVVVLLEEIYACEKTFERIFLGALFGPNAPHFIAGWRSDFRDQDENTRAMVYFLHHATGLNMTLPVWIARYEQERMIKFIDIPIESCGRSSPLRVALQASAPDLLLILLRYGADPNPPDGGTSVVLSLLDKLIENGRNYVFQHISCLQILLRNIPKIELPYKPIIYSTRRTMFFERYGRLLIDRIISNDQVYGVMSLRHLCRCRIRDLLRSNGQLPDGIDTLRLPRRLQRYIDLMEEIEGPKDDDTKNNEKPTTSKKAKQVRIVVDDCDVKKEKPTTSKALTEKSSYKSKDTSANTSTSTPTTDEMSTSSDKTGTANSSSSIDSCSTISASVVDIATSSSEKDTATTTRSSSSTLPVTLVDSYETITVIDCAPTDSDTISATDTTPTATITIPVPSAVNAIPGPHTSTVVIIDKPFPTEIVATSADADAAAVTATDAMPDGPSTDADVVAADVIDKPISCIAAAAAAAPTGDDAAAFTSDTSVSTSNAASTVVIIDKPFSL